MQSLSEPQTPIRKPSPVVRIGKWIGLLLCVALLILFVVSLRVAITWDSQDSLTQISFMSGRIVYGWRAEGWETSGKYCVALTPGWSVSEYGSTYMQPIWQIELYKGKCWEGYGVPMWIPFVLLAPVTVLLWRRDPINIRTAIQRWEKRLYPRQEKRVTFKLIGIITLLHITFTTTISYCLMRFVFFFFPYSFRESFMVLYHCIGWAGMVSLLGTPIWALLESWGYVHFSNWLLAKNPSHCCKKCGYNLTGNISGRCPECGTNILPIQSNAVQNQET